MEIFFLKQLKSINIFYNLSIDLFREYAVVKKYEIFEILDIYLEEITIIN